MSMLSAKTSGFSQIAADCRRAAQELANDEAVREALVEAVTPVATTAQANMAKLTGRTAAQVTVDDKIPSAPGLVKVGVGIPSPKVLGKSSRSFIGRFLEFGTSKTAAKPWLRPAYDSQREQIGARFAAALRGKIGSIFRSGA